MNRLVPITVALITQFLFMPRQAMAQVASWSASSSGSGIGPGAVANGSISTPGAVAATFAPQGGVGIQNYGVPNPSVTNVGGPSFTAGMVGSTFSPQGGTGIQNYGTTNPGSLPSMGIIPLPNFSSSTNFGTTNNYGSTSYSAIPTVLPNTLAAPFPSFSSVSQSGLSSATYTQSP